ncbi:MAG: HIT domain-containing protein [Anaerolineaceae bacterium]|nr:HIT domain-containing protein [Anaerolineaceae bacterium]
MEQIYSPWRMAYLGKVSEKQGCVFCTALCMEEDSPENLVVYRGERCFIILNKYPYASGHAMVVPYLHVQNLEDLNAETQAEMMSAASKAVEVLKLLYKPQGFNLGMNIGSAAGAGIAEHLHLHVVPRWVGDSNFVSVVGQTRVLPETLEQSYERFSNAWQERFEEGMQSAE